MSLNPRSLPEYRDCGLPFPFSCACRMIAGMDWLLLNHNLRGQGTWHRAWAIGRELARRGERVELWTVAPRHYYRVTRERLEGVQIVEMPSFSPFVRADDGWGLIDLPWRAGQAIATQTDMVYAFSHAPNVALPAWLLKRLRAKPLLYDWCDGYAYGIFPKREERRAAGLESNLPPLQRWAERREVALEHSMPRLADGMTVISNKLRDLALDLGVASNRLLLVPNGAPLDVIQPSDCPAARAALGLAAALPPDAEVLAYVANYHPDEAFFLEAFAQAGVIRPKLRLLYTGPPFNRELAARHGVAGRLIALGVVPGESIPTILAAANALALPLENHPSNIARLPFKFTDYLAAGRPVVTCAVGDVGHYFELARATEGEIGIAAEPDVNAFGCALADIFECHSQADREQLGRNARRFAEQAFGWPALVEPIMDLASQIARKRRA